MSPDRTGQSGIPARPTRAGRGTATFTFRHKFMRGEHFLLLAEREQLLPPAVLTQLRQILRNQKRPARGEAVARLLVERGFITVEQARRLIEAGSGTGSPLVGSPNPLAALPGSASKASNPLAPRRPSQTPLSNSAELILEPVPDAPHPPPLAEQKRVQSDRPADRVTPPPVVTGAASPPVPSDATGDSVPPPPVISGMAPDTLQSDTSAGMVNPAPPGSRSSKSPLPPPPPSDWSTAPLAPMDEASMSELSDSFSQWMDLPTGPNLAEQPPSPLFAPQGVQIPKVLLYIGLATFGVLFVLFGLMVLTKLRTG